VLLKGNEFVKQIIVLKGLIKYSRFETLHNDARQHNRDFNFCLISYHMYIKLFDFV
jgi:hypothetical protein